VEISDTAAINACNCSWTKRGTIIRYNYIHDPLGFGRGREGWVSPYYCWGIYLDNVTCGVHVYGNILARIYLGGPFIHGGRDNLIENNIIIDGATRQMTYSSWKPTPGKQTERMDKGFIEYATLPAYAKYPKIKPLLAMNMEDRLKMAGNRFVRNIMYYSGADAMLYRHRNLDFATSESDYNLIWHFNQPLLTDSRGTIQPEKQWDAWKKHGFEKHSIIADPLFVDAKNDDYRLKPDSPAFKLGFKQIPVEKIGPYKSPLRASWPIVEAEGVRERPLNLDVLPKAPKRPPRSKRLPVFSAPRLKTPITIDGDVRHAEWNQVNMRRGITLKEDVRGDIVKPVSFAWITHDDKYLYIAFRNGVDPKIPLKTEAKWGENDAVEVAICNPEIEGAPTFVLRGFTKGQFESSVEAGVSFKAAAALEKAVEYGARIVSKGEWTAEWRIPFAALGIDPTKHKKVLFNLTARKTANDYWQMWRATHGASWKVENAAWLKLVEKK